MLDSIKNGTDGSASVAGLIFASDITVANTEETYTKPEIISETIVSQAMDLQQYCFNYDTDNV